MYGTWLRTYLTKTVFYKWIFLFKIFSRYSTHSPTKCVNAIILIQLTKMVSVNWSCTFSMLTNEKIVSSCHLQKVIN